MDQREWDYGARMSRDRRAAEAWPTREPEIAEAEPRWASLADTGSLAPSEEALTWQRRADAWAQQAEVEPYSSGSQAVEPVNRWSEVASTGRPTFPADGVGWRTQTAEWRATGARWRQTTEWRSTTGSHVWRSTTEAWRAGDDYTPEREKPAISGTAWPTPESDQRNETPSWQRREPEETPSWRRSDDPSPATQPVEQTWSSSSPSWQQPSAPTPSWQRSTDRRRDTEQQQPGENTVGMTRWERTEAPGWQTSPVDDARHLVREDDRAAWQRDAGYAERQPRRGRRRAPETDSTPSGGTGWSSASDSTDNWARHTDTGNIQSYPDSPDGGQPTRGARAEAPRRRSRREPQTPVSYGEPTSSAPAGYPGSPAETGAAERSGGRRGRPARYNQNATDWREQTASWEAEPDTSNWTRDPDTGQWSRAEDDPRVLAWRAEAARRESMKAGDEDGDTSPRRSRRSDPPSGGVPGGPLPSSGVPGGSTSGAAWPASGVPDDARIGVPSTRPRSAMPSTRPRSAMPGAIRPNSATPGSTPWSGAATPSSPGAHEQERGRRHRDDTYGTPEPPAGGGGRRRAPEQPGPEAWQATSEPRPSRQSRRQSAEPEEYQTGGWRQGPLPPRQAYGSPRELPAGGPAWAERSRELPPVGPSSWEQPSRETPSWAEREPRQPYRDSTPSREMPPAGPSWAEREPRQPSSSGPSWAEREPRQPSPPGPPSWAEREPRQPSPSGPSWAEREPRQPYRDPTPSRELPPAGPSWAEREPRQPYRDSTPSRELPPAGPSWSDQEPRRPSYGGPRELPAGGSQWPDTGRQTSGAPSWADQEQRRPSYGAPRELPAGPSWQQEQQGSPAYGAPGASQWPDPLSQPRRASAPAYGASESPQRGYDDRDDPPAGGGYGQARVPKDWLTTERAARRGAQYRDGAGQDGETDWRQELSRDDALTEGESRRYDTSDFPPFRPSGSATVPGASNLALSATSVISRAPEAPAEAPEEEDTSWPPRRTTGAFQGTGSYERRPVGGGLLTGRGNDLLNPDEDDEEEEEATGGPLAAVGYTVVWYGVPVILFVAGIFLLNTGERSQALDTLAGAAPEFGISLALSMLVALGLRWATTAWKSASVGLAAAVVGGGLATVLSSAITGNSLS